MKRNSFSSIFIKHKRVIFLFLLGIFLFVPYVLKLLSYGALEPYPAIVFPAGASKLKLEANSYTFKDLGIYCLDLKAKEWKRQDAYSFLEPIPVQNLSSIIKNEFGLNPNLKHQVKFRRISLGFSYENAQALSEANIDLTKAWLRGRLAEHGCHDNFLLVKTRYIAIGRETQMTSEVNKIDEKLYELR
jgi:hypothetical protein